MDHWENYRLDPLDRLTIPWEAMQALGWAPGELLELKLSDGKNALLVRPQNGVCSDCCACHSPHALLPVGGGRWLCKSCFDIAAAVKPEYQALDNVLP